MSIDLITTILTRTPLWVWVLLAVLLALGWQQSKARAVARWQLLMLPVAMLGLGLSSVAPGFARVPMSLATWALGLLVGGAIALRWLLNTQARWDHHKQRLHLPASWLPMVLILAIFLLKYSLGVYGGMNPAGAAQAPFVMAVAGLSGALSGIFLGRAVGLWRKTSSSAPLPLISPV